MHITIHKIVPTVKTRRAGICILWQREGLFEKKPFSLPPAPPKRCGWVMGIMNRYLAVSIESEDESTYFWKIARN